MKYLKIPPRLRDDRRILESAERLDIPPIQMLGHVLSLWLWALENALDGHIGYLSSRVIAQASRLDETVLRLLDEEDVHPSDYLRALIASGLIDDRQDGLYLAQL